MRAVSGTIWQLRMLCDGQLHSCSFVRLEKGGRWHRIANWKADLLVSAGLARWIDDRPRRRRGRNQESKRQRWLFA